MTKNRIVHWELLGEDSGAMRTFYSKVFDWKPADVEGFPHYYMVEDEGIGLAGAIGRGPEEMPSYSCIYVSCNDINETLKTVEGAGGKTVVPRTVIPDVVTFALFTDPAGNLVGLSEGE